uniref:ADP-ribosyltransferase 3 (inactive) n=1 Tax=Sus scrofa TaxID=9823 RepID=A0ABB5UPV6_PIG
MKTGHFEMVTILLAPVILMDIFQIYAEEWDCWITWTENCRLC